MLTGEHTIQISNDPVTDHEAIASALVKNFVVRTRADSSSSTAKAGDVTGLDAALARTGVRDGDRGFNLSWHDGLNLRSLIAVSRVIATSALAREDSRGAHFREDHPDTGVLSGSTFIVITQQDGALQINREPVRFTRVAPGETILVDEHRSA